MSIKTAFLHEGFARLVRGRLRGVWIRGRLPSGPVVWAANHHSWWDPFLADVVIRASGRAPGLVMDDENLDRFGFLRDLNVVGAHQPRGALELVRAGHVLVLFPEGELRPAGSPGPLARGAAWMAARADADLVAAAVRVTVRGHEAPEAYVSLHVVNRHENGEFATLLLEETLRQALADMDEAISEVDPRAPLPDFRLLVSGRRSWDERLSGLPVRRRR